MAGEEKRYNFIREKSGLSKKDFAASLGLSLSMSYQISSGRIKPPRELLERLSSKYNVNLHWFLTGNGFSGLDEDYAEIELMNRKRLQVMDEKWMIIKKKVFLGFPFLLSAHIVLRI